MKCVYRKTIHRHTLQGVYYKFITYIFFKFMYLQKKIRLRVKIINKCLSTRQDIFYHNKFKQQL